MIDSLPSTIQERTTVLQSGNPHSSGFVLYWMRTAVRTVDNPALEAAIHLSNHLDVPVFVYHALSERYHYASDRHHRFVLEGARDVQRECAQRGIGYAFHLEREGHRGAHLKQLWDRAAVVVSEDMPIPLLRRWTVHLGTTSRTPALLVDTSCIVPMRLSRSKPKRAFQFRDAFRHVRDRNIRQEMPATEPKHKNFLPDLPFAPVDLQSVDLNQLIAQCDIDHSVAPVANTPGGSVAGLQRWTAFKRNGLSRYHLDRNDPLRKGVSRMSAYLHYGHVSPFQLAREAEGYGKGGTKYLDELLIWRELAYHWCWHTPDPHQWTALPQWAQQTLSKDRGLTEQQFSWRELAYAQTDSTLWNICQAQLHRYGELHNNLRMTWGKQILLWTRDGQQAQRFLIDLNNRYALDGRDPSSFAGLLWCLGLFDRPFKPAKRHFGLVRPRTMAHHESRIDVDRHRRNVLPPLGQQPCRVALVGPAFFTFVCAEVLQRYDISSESFCPAPPPQYDESTFEASNRHFVFWLKAWEECNWAQHTDHGHRFTELGNDQLQHHLDRTTPSEQWNPESDHDCVFVAHTESKRAASVRNQRQIAVDLSSDCSLEEQWLAAMHCVGRLLRRLTKHSATPEPQQQSLFSLS